MSEVLFAHPMFAFYKEYTDKIDAIDSKIGDASSSGRAALNTLVKENTSYVAEAQQLLAPVFQIEDETERLVKMVTLQRLVRDFSTQLDAYVKANTVEAAEKVAEEERAKLLSERSDLQKMAKQLHGVLEITFKENEEALAALPKCPEGIRGATGPRGEMGRKIPKGFFYTIDGEEIEGPKTAAEAAKLAGVKTSELRVAVQAAYPDALPNEWTVTVGKKVIEAIREDDVNDTEDDSDDDDTADSGSVSFDD